MLGLAALEGSRRPDNVSGHLGGYHPLVPAGLVALLVVLDTIIIASSDA